MKIKKKELFGFVSSILIMIIGIALICWNTIFKDATLAYALIMPIYAIIKMVEYFLVREKGDYENLLIAFISMITGGVMLYMESNNLGGAMLLPVSLISWASALAILKLIKVDFLMDRKNKTWYVELFILILFVISSILASVSLYHSNEVQNLVLGFFFLITGFLEFLYPLVNVYFSRKLGL